MSKYEVEYFSSAQEVQTQLLTGKTNLAMLAEPAVTATITITITARILRARALALLFEDEYEEAVRE